MKPTSTLVALLSLGVSVLALPASHAAAAGHDGGDVLLSRRRSSAYERLLSRRSAAAQGVKKARLRPDHSSAPANHVSFGKAAGNDGGLASPSPPVLVRDDSPASSDSRWRRDVWEGKHGRGPRRESTGDSVSANTTGAVHGGSDDFEPVSVSSNWAGAVLHLESGFVGVQGIVSVPVPKASNITYDNQSSSYAGAAWVGIDGDTCQRAILQTGIDWEVDSKTGETSFSAWYEYFPQGSFTFEGFEVQAGDDIALTAQVPGDGDLDGGLVTVTNLRTGKMVSKTFTDETTTLCGMDAEWIVEDYMQCSGSTCTLVNFADFGTVAFSSASATKLSGTATNPSATADSATTSSGSSSAAASGSSSTASGSSSTSPASSPTSPASHSAPHAGDKDAATEAAKTSATTSPNTAPDVKVEQTKTPDTTVTETVWITVTATPEARDKSPERYAEIQGRQAAGDLVVVGLAGAEIMALGVAKNEIVTDCSVVGDDGLICVYTGGH